MLCGKSAIYSCFKVSECLMKLFALPSIGDGSGTFDVDRRCFFSAEEGKP